VSNGRFLSWTFSQNVATLTVASGKTDGST